MSMMMVTTIYHAADTKLKAQLLMSALPKKAKSNLVGSTLGMFTGTYSSTPGLNVSRTSKAPVESPVTTPISTSKKRRRQSPGTSEFKRTKKRLKFDD